jgi:hypothetical protein
MTLCQQRPDPNALRPQPSRAGERDDWPTPDSLLTALVQHVLPALPGGLLWEPAIGPGAVLASALRAAGRAVVASPIGEDFLTTTRAPSGCVGVTTNPPFNILTEFSQHAVDLLDAGQLQSVTLLWRCDHPGAAERAALWNRAAHVLNCCWRPRWIPNTQVSPRFWFLWITWLRDHTGGPIARAITLVDLRIRPPGLIPDANDQIVAVAREASP